MAQKAALSAPLAAALALSLFACGKTEEASSDSSTAEASKTYVVGICQLVQHAALDAATQGFEDALTAEFGDNVKFDFQNAQGDSATCATIANRRHEQAIVIGEAYLMGLLEAFGDFKVDRRVQ